MTDILFVSPSLFLHENAKMSIIGTKRT